MKKTVADKLNGLKVWRAHVAGMNQAESPFATPAWKKRVYEGLDVQMERLKTFPPDTPLLKSPADALRSDLLDAEEKFIVAWQHRDKLGLSDYERARFDLLLAADDRNLRELAKLWPDDVSAITRWRMEPGYANRVRGLPIDFDL